MSDGLCFYRTAALPLLMEELKRRLIGAPGARPTSIVQPVGPPIERREGLAEDPHNKLDTLQSLPQTLYEVDALIGYWTLGNWEQSSR